jgi:hypothetical protein
VLAAKSVLFHLHGLETYEEVGQPGFEVDQVRGCLSELYRIGFEVILNGILHLFSLFLQIFQLVAQFLNFLLQFWVFLGDLFAFLFLFLYVEFQLVDFFVESLHVVFTFLDFSVFDALDVCFFLQLPDPFLLKQGSMFELLEGLQILPVLLEQQFFTVLFL